MFHVARRGFENHCKIPAEGIPEEGSTGGEILTSRLPVYGTKDAGRGLWLRLKNTCKQFGCSLNQILPTLFTLRDDDSEIIARCLLMWTICCMAILPEGAEVVNSVTTIFSGQRETR